MQETEGYRKWEKILKVGEAGAASEDVKTIFLMHLNMKLGPLESPFLIVLR